MSQAQEYSMEDIELKSRLAANGYLQLPTHLRPAEPEGVSTVRYFIDYRCPYCKLSHEFIQVWRTTLPAGYMFRYEVVVSDKPADLLLAMATEFVFISELDNFKKNRFMDHLYEHTPNIDTVEKTGRLVREALIDVGLKPNELTAYMLDEANQAMFEARHEEHVQIRVQNTPAVLVGGKIFTHYGLTQGEPGKWLEILNGVVSKHIYMERDEPVSGSK
jgi:hypothetical protein